MKSSFILVSGSITSGKSTLLSLLDGHSDIFTLPFLHDKILTGILNIPIFDGLPSWFTDYMDAYNIINYIYDNTDLKILRLISFQKEILMHIDRNKTLRIPFDFKFNVLEQNIFDELKYIKREYILPNYIGEIVFSNMSKLLHGKEFRYYLSQAENGFVDYNNIIKKYPNIKIIFIKRDRFSWIYAHVKRASFYLNKRFDVVLTQIFENDTRIKNLLYLEQLITYYAKDNPYNITILDFDELIHKTQFVTKKLLNYLEIKDANALRTTTVLGKSVPLLRYVRDDVYRDASAYEMSCIRQTVHDYIKRTWPVESGIAEKLAGNEVYFWGCGEMLRHKKWLFESVKPICILDDTICSLSDDLIPRYVDDIPVLHPDTVLPHSKPLPIIIFAGQNATSIIRDKITKYPSVTAIYACSPCL